MHYGMLLVAVLEAGNTFPFAAHYDGYLLLVPDEDPKLADARIGDRWQVRIEREIKGNTWIVTLLEPVEGGTPCAEFETPLVPLADRRVGLDTPNFLVVALQSLPSTVEVSLYHEDDKGIFGIYQGTVIRPIKGGKWTYFGETWVLTPIASGSRGIYCVPIRMVKPKIDVIMQLPKVPPQFSATFDKRDGRGVYCEFLGYIVRPDRNWKPGPDLGATITVSPVRVLTHSIPIIFAAPYQGVSSEY